MPKMQKKKIFPVGQGSVSWVQKSPLWLMFAAAWLFTFNERYNTNAVNKPLLEEKQKQEMWTVHYIELSAYIW